MYTNRIERAEFIAKTFSDYLGRSVLDVGCWEKDLKNFLPSRVKKYIGVDVAGKPDINCNLENQDLPFPDDSFDCVVCTDVLEHLDGLHRVFKETIRTSREYIIVSLPNNWQLLKNILFRKNNVNLLKYYGLPTLKPEDRHKWFFNISESTNFFITNAMGSGYTIEKMSVVETLPVNFWKRMTKKFLKFFISEEVYNNLFAIALWVVLKKVKK
jgi:SAM-dependent methyltransferase